MISRQWIPNNVRKSLIDLVKKFKTSRIKYLIVGAIPVQYYGRPRISWDVDAVLMMPITKEKLFRILNPHRYALVHNEGTALKFKDLKTNSFIDILLDPTKLGLTPESFSRKRMVRIIGMKVNIPSPEDYIITKLTARRSGTNDYSDMITTLTNMYNRLDWSYLEMRTKELGLHHLIKHYKEGLMWKLK